MLNFKPKNKMDFGRILRGVIPVLVALALWELVVRGLIMKNTYDDSARLEGPRQDHLE